MTKVTKKKVLTKAKTAKKAVKKTAKKAPAKKAKVAKKAVKKTVAKKKLVTVIAEGKASPSMHS